MSLHYKETVLESWTDAKRLLSVDKTGWAWRGHGDSRWSLVSSLERAVRHLKARRRDTEEMLYQTFTRRAHHYLPEELTDKADYLQWLSIMQHYGAPTRLLDWSYSPYIAAFFAFENATNPDGSCAVWAINFVWCGRQAKKLLKGVLHEGMVIKPGTIWEATLFKNVLLDRELDLVVPLEPYRLNRRLTLQQGLFLCQGNLERSFEENLSSYEHQKDNLIKFVLPNYLRAQALSDLNSMGLNLATLFPGIDGFARSLHHMIVEREDPRKATRVVNLAHETDQYIESHPHAAPPPQAM
jgi:hypothetical protein